MIVKDKVALITGGVSGLGLCFAKNLLRNGLRGVCLVDINEAAGQNVLPQLEKEFGKNKAVFMKIDVTNKTEFEEAFKKTVEVFSSIDILINCAGVANELNITRLIDINLNATITGTILAMDDYLPKYRSSEAESVVVNVASIFGLDGSEFLPGYSASKHGVIGLGKSLGTERHYKQTGVKIVTICPGFTDTSLVVELDKRVLPGRYVDMVKEEIPKVIMQKTEVVSKALIKILEKSETGSVWVVEDGECYEVEIPTRFTLKKKNSACNLCGKSYKK